MIILVLISILLIALYIKTNHFYKLPINTYVFDSYKLLGNKKINLLGPSGNHFVYGRAKDLKILAVPLGIKDVRIIGYLNDTTKFIFKMEYTFNVSKDEEKQKELYSMLKSDKLADQNLSIIQEYIQEKANDFVADVMKDKCHSDFKTRIDKDFILYWILEQIRNYDYCVDFHFLSASLDIALPVSYEQFEKVGLTFKELEAAGYDEQQINQILKASEKNIYLNNINPIVPESVFRKIRRIYDENNKMLKEYIFKLTFKNKTPREVEEICDNILAF